MVLIMKLAHLVSTWLFLGHGPIGDTGTMEGMKQFLTELYKGVDAAIRDGKTLDQSATRNAGRPVLRLLSESGGAIPGYLECEQESPDMLPEVRRSLAYCRRLLAE